MTLEAEPLAALLDRRGKLQRELKVVREAIAARAAAAARAKLTRLSPHAQAVLAALAEHFHGEDDWAAFPFKSLAGTRTGGLTRDQVRRACRALARLGFAKCELSLWTDDGEPIGAGYRATVLGVAHHALTGPEPVQ